MPRDRVAGIVLAAGTSSRAGAENKLLLPVEGVPLVRRGVEAALEAGLDPVLVVTGIDAAGIRKALAGLAVGWVEGPVGSPAMSASLARGVAAVPADAVGAAVLLGDMPWVGAAHLNRLLEAFRTLPVPGVCVPTFGGMRGNPLVWSSVFFGEILMLTGDVGARGLLARHPDRVREVEMDDEAVLSDIDTLDDWRSARPPTGGG